MWRRQRGEQERGELARGPAALPGHLATTRLGWLVKPSPKVRALGFCGLFCSESKAASLGALALAFYQPAVPLKVCIPEGETVMVLGSLG